MHSTQARDKILKSWREIGEINIIKEVATKGENIELCIEYWARKRKISETEYTLYFHDVVQTYVERLLTERLVCKAETVLRNVKRNVKCFYYQFAQECEDADLRDTVLEHMRSRESAAFEQEERNLQFFFELLQQLRECTPLMVKFRKQLPRINLERLIDMEHNCQQRLFVELYFAKGNDELLEQLDKYAVWQYLVDNQQASTLSRWLTLNAANQSIATETRLEQVFLQWPLEPEMYEYGLKHLNQPNEVLRNCFARMGYIFKDEINDIRTILQRLCTTESISQNKLLLQRLPLAEYLHRNGYYELMLQPLVESRALEELVGDSNELLQFIVTLKMSDLEERAGFEAIAQATSKYLKSSKDEVTEQPIVVFHEFLCHEPNIAALRSFVSTTALNRLLYLKTLMQRSEHSTSATARVQQPTAHDFLRKFRNINFVDFNSNADNGDVASFSNERLCQRYGRKYQLNYMHYLKQHRSAYAVYYLLTEQLQLYAQITPTQLFHASESIIDLVLTQADTNNELLTHCVACCEMLGFDTQSLRCYLQLRKLLITKSDVAVLTYNNFIRRIDTQLTEELAKDSSSFPLQHYQSLMHLGARDFFTNSYSQELLKHFAESSDWWHLLVVLQYFDVPLKELKKLVEYFESRTSQNAASRIPLEQSCRTLEHLLRALSHELPVNERANKRHAGRQHNRRVDKTHTNSAETIETASTSVSSIHEAHNRIPANTVQQTVPDDCAIQDLFAIILQSKCALPEERIENTAKFLELIQSNEKQASSVNLLKHCVKYQQPVLAILATTLNSTNIDWSWLVWLTVSTEQWQNFLENANKSEQDYVWLLFKRIVHEGQTLVLLNSFEIFYKENPLLHLFRFLQQTQMEHNFSEATIAELRMFLLGWSNDAIILPLCSTTIDRDQFMQRCINLLITHLQKNFVSALHQQKFLDCICRSDISDICGGMLDFCLLNRVFSISAAWMSQLGTNFELLVQRDSKEYTLLLNALIDAKAYDDAIQLATMLQFPICDIVYSKWVAAFDAGKLHEYKEYEREIKEHALPPEILVNFFLYAGARETELFPRKYTLLKSALDVIKQHHLFPNESFDRDQIEYDMTLCYLQAEEQNEEIDVKQLGLCYHSEYFEQIMVKERCVLYKSFMELKELAGIDDLSITTKTVLSSQMQQRLESLLNALLDQGDIVEALRLQEIFEYRPTDLRFVVFCMALAEGVTTVFNMSAKERQLLSEVDKAAFAKFNKLTLNQSHLGRGAGSGDLSDSCSTLEFEEIPSKEKQQTLEIIQGIASKLKYGAGLGKRVVLVYRAAMYLDKEYLDVLRTKDVSVLLKSAAEEDCMHRLMVISDILVSTHMTPKEIADLLAAELVTCIVRPRFYIFNSNQQQQSSNVFKNADLWGYNIDRDFHLFLELTPNTTLLGNCLLEYCDAMKTYRRYQDNKAYEQTEIFQRLSNIITLYGQPNTAATTTAATANDNPPPVLSHKKQNIIYVELLIKAHQCFVHECSMEGIANVLHRAKSLNVQLTTAKSWVILVRMLIGIARYREMFYCFDALIENEQFESLLGQFDEEQKCGLRQAILAYLREYNPPNGQELLKLAALHFLMYKELAEMWEQEAQLVLTKVRGSAQIGTAQEHQNSVAIVGVSRADRRPIARLKITADLLPMLQQALEFYTHATENYLLDNKLLLAQQSASMAELVAMQIDLANKSSTICVSVVNIQTRDDFRELVNNELSVPQSLILSRAYGYDINWSEALLSQFVILQRKNYLRDYLSHQRITDAIIDNIVKGYLHYMQQNSLNPIIEDSLMQLVDLIKSITLKYKLASILGLKTVVVSLITDSSMYYLRDTNFGRSENHNMPDM